MRLSSDRPSTSATCQAKSKHSLTTGGSRVSSTSSASGRCATKSGRAFVTGGAISNGKEVTMLSILAAMLVNQMIAVGGGGAFGASATTGPDSPGIDDKELAEARDLGKRVAEIAVVSKRGSAT